VDAVETRDDAVQPIVRPPFLRWLWYCYGGSLPSECKTWVLHDLTCRTWVLRHFARWLMLIVPLFVLYLLLIPGSFNLRLFTGLTFAGALVMFALVNILIDTDRRARRAGYPHSEPQRIRGAAAEQRQRDASYRRREQIAARRARSRARR